MSIYGAHTNRRMNQCCSDYRLSKHIATSDILYKPLLSFSRIMSPVSPREREVSPSRRSLSPPAELAADYIYIYIYAFSRRFYPKRLTLHSSYSFYILSALAFPGNRTHDRGVANAMLYQLSYRKANRLTEWTSGIWTRV